MSDIVALLFPDAFVKALFGLLAVTVLDLAFGVAVAIKARKFEWSALADFYTSDVLPVVLGWAVSDVVLRLCAYYDLPIVSQVQPLATGGLYTVAMVSFMAQIGSKLNVLRGQAAAK